MIVGFIGPTDNVYRFFLLPFIKILRSPKEEKLKIEARELKVGAIFSEIRQTKIILAPLNSHQA